ncbi:MAG: MFS transporter [Pseudomonadota bacterium]
MAHRSLRAPGQWTWLAIPLFSGLYAAQGMTGSLVQTALPTALRDAGMALDKLGFLYFLYLPWALKFLWAPAVDRFSVMQLGRRRFWLLLCQSGLIISLIVVGFLPPDPHLYALLAALLIVALLASTQDIATDALAVEATAENRRSLVSGAGVGGAYLGFLIGIGLWLPIYAAVGWMWAMLAMAGCLIVCTVPALLARPFDQTSSDVEMGQRPSVWSGLKNPTLRRGLLFLVVYQAGLRLGIALLGPFLVDSGMSLTEIGWLKGTGGAIIGFAAAVLGCLVLRWIGPRAALVSAALGQAVLYGSLAAVALGGYGDREFLVVLILALSAVTSFAFVSLYTVMMGWCRRTQTGTDFALLQSADAVVAIALAAVAGLVSEAFGHATNFAASAVLLTCGAAAALCLSALIPRLAKADLETAQST